MKLGHRILKMTTRFEDTYQNDPGCVIWLVARTVRNIQNLWHDKLDSEARNLNKIGIWQALYVNKLCMDLSWPELADEASNLLIFETLDEGQLRAFTSALSSTTSTKYFSSATSLLPSICT